VSAALSFEDDSKEGPPKATKYLGGHSDLLAGVVVVRTEAEWRDMWHTRVNLGNNAVCHRHVVARLD